MDKYSLHSVNDCVCNILCACVCRYVKLKIISELGAAEGKQLKPACNVNFMIMLGIVYLSYLRVNETNDIVK